MASNGTRKINKETGTIAIIWHILLCLILSAIILLGMVIALSPENKTITSIMRANSTGVIITYALLVLCIWVLMDKLFCCIDRSVQVNAKAGTLRENDFHKTYLNALKIAAVLFLCWSPYLIICYPTITRGYDFFWQLLQGMGLFPLSNHHPVLGSLVFGGIFRIGYAIGGASFGLALISLVQMLLLSLSMGFAFAVLQIIATVPRKVFFILVAYAGFCPVFADHAVWAVKDTIFTAFTIIMISQFLLHIWCITYKVSIPLIASLPAFTITAVLFSLYRNGTSPIAAAFFLVLVFFNLITCRKKERALKTAAAMMIFLIVVFSWGRLLSALDVYPTNTREAVSLPTRQIIRTLQVHPEDLDEETEAFLKSLYHDQVAYGTDIRSIIDRYDDYNADYIKIDYVTDDNFMSEFLRYWIRLGIRHPGSYIDALMRGTDGYWYYGQHPHLEANGIVIHTVCTMGPEDDFASDEMLDRRLNSIFWPTVKSLEHAGMDTEQTFRDLCKDNPWLNDLMHVRSPFPGKRIVFGDYLAALENVPVLALVLAPGTYFFILIICLGYMFERKKIGRFLWPLILIEAIAWLSPVNGYTRYVLPVEMISLLLIGACFSDEPIIKEETIDG